MIWYVIGYLAIALIVAGVACKDANNGKEVTKDVLTSLVWPLILVMSLIWMAVLLISEAKTAYYARKHKH